MGLTLLSGATCCTVVLAALLGLPSITLAQPADAPASLARSERFVAMAAPDVARIGGSFETPGAATPPLDGSTATSSGRGPLLPLYASAVALQGLDVYTTRRGMRAGAQESNSAIRGGTVASTVAYKALTTAAGIAVAEKLWKKNKTAAVLAMVATNALSAAVVANNYRVIKQLEGR